MNIGILVTVRLNSKRLRRKALRLIMGKPMLVHMLDRLKRLAPSRNIVICTSTSLEDRPLCRLAEKEGVECFRGDPEDVLLRLAGAARKFKFNIAACYTGDNPLIDVDLARRMIRAHISGSNDLTICDGFPIGSYGFIVSGKAMEKALRLKDTKDTENWVPYFTETGFFKVGVIRSMRRKDLRLTVDTLQDFKFISEIFRHLYKPGHIFKAGEIAGLIKRKPGLARINAGVVQRKWKPIRIRKSVRTKDKI